MDENKLIQKILEVTKDLLEELDFDAEISGHVVEGEKERKYIHVKIKGENLGLLIGHQGKTLRSFEQVTGMMISKFLKQEGVTQDIRIVVDVNEYKKQREEHIKEMVLKAIDQVRESKQKIELPAMNPAERRIVHMVIKSEDGILSTSEGDEGDRRVILSLAE